MRKFLFFTILLPSIIFAQFPETFDTEIPSNWAVFPGANGEGPNQQWKWINGSVYSVFENVPTISEDYLVTPQFTVSGETPFITFDLRQTYFTDYESIFEVKISTNTQTNPADFGTTLLSLTEAQISPGWGLQAVDLSAYIGQNVYIAFVHIQHNGDTLGIDNVNLSNGCLPPASFQLSDYTATSCVLTWPEEGDYEIEFGEYPYEQGSGGTSFIVNGVNSYTFTELSGATAYTVYIRRNCGNNEFSDWEETIIGTTPNTVTSYPYSFNLEPLSNQALLINLYSRVSTAGIWNFIQDNLNDNDTSNDYALSPISFVSSAMSPEFAQNNWIFFGPFSMQSNAQYNISIAQRVFLNSSATAPMNMEIAVAPTNDGNNTTVLQTLNGLSNITYTNRSVTYTPAETGTYYIGFHNITPAAPGAQFANYVMLDDLFVTETLGVDDVDYSNEVSTIYPNPVKNQLNILLSEKFDASKTNVSITDMNGKLIMNRTYKENIDVSNLSRGVYIITISDGITTENQKLIKE